MWVRAAAPFSAFYKFVIAIKRSWARAAACFVTLYNCFYDDKAVGGAAGSQRKMTKELIEGGEGEGDTHCNANIMKTRSG